MSRKAAVLVALTLALCSVAIAYSATLAIWFRYDDEWASGELTVFDAADYYGHRVGVLSYGLIALAIAYAVRLGAQAAALATGRPSSLPWSTLQASMSHAGGLVLGAVFLACFPPRGTEQVPGELGTVSVTFERAGGMLWLLGGLAGAQCWLYILHARALRAFHDGAATADADPASVGSAAKQRPLVKSPLATPAAVDADPFRAPPRPVIAPVPQLATPKPAPRTEVDVAADEPKLLR